MHANSHQCNASQQQQRCVNGGINQQNSLYGLNVATSANDMSQQQQFRPNHMFDLANLHQDQQASNNSHSLFDSVYDDSPNSLGGPAGNFNQQQSDHMLSSQQSNKMTTSNATNGKHHQTTDVSLYSPSSSTSLLYHHYDQISVPSEQLSSSNQNSSSNNNNGNNFKRSNTTTTLNPSNLFGMSQHTMPPQQHQVGANQQHFMTTNKTTIPQQELYSNGTQYHLQQPMNAFQHHHQTQHPLQPMQYAVDNHQLMLDTILRQQHAATNATTRAIHLGGFHNRPLSSSGASSMSGQSMALTYGRQPRQLGGQLPPLPPINPSKSQNTLASALQSNQTLNHLGLSLNGHLSHSMMDTRGPKKVPHSKYPSSSSCVGVSGGSGASRLWKRAQQRVQNFAYEYSNFLRCSMLLIIIAFISLSILKFTSMSGSQIHVQPIKVMDTLRSDAIDMNRRNGPNSQHMSNFESSSVPPDVLSSKLLIGEFVISSQNYTGSEAQRLVMAENIVKLMDQVFLSTDMRRFYSRMRVTEFVPHKPTGVLVKCNIILSESILYAAQQFGIALYDSLAKSNEKLANQPSFIIDKNSIRFNTIPDKDLASVPPQLLPPGLARPDPIAAPSDAQTFNHPSPIEAQQSNELKPASNASPTLVDQDQNAVVWSEWSNWSSCVDKNGICDSSRLHSRVRTCVSQLTGEKVDDSECKQRFNTQDSFLEIRDCATTCANSPMGSSVLSDAPHVIPPITAPSVLTGGPSSEPSSFMLPSQLTRSSADRFGPFDTPDSGVQQQHPGGIDSYPGATTSPPALIANGRQQQAQPLASTQPSTTTALSSQDPSAPLVHLAGAEGSQQQMSCSNCTSSEICLLTINQKVPFCAKIKDRLDESGCGGWCKAHDQVCQPAGQNAFKCSHNNECLASEWRCHDSQCIPASKRCDGHENCFDSSDEAFCP